MNTDEQRPYLAPVSYHPPLRWLTGFTRPFGRGIRLKLVLVSLVILIVVSFGSLLLHHLIASSWIDEDLRGRAVTFAKDISSTIAQHKVQEGAPLIAEEIRRIMAVRSNVLQIEIRELTPTSVVLIGSSDANTRLPFSDEDADAVRRGSSVYKLAKLDRTRAWDISVPIVVDDAVVGAVSTRFSLDRADRLRFRINLWALAFTGLSVLLMGYLMALAVTYTVNRPIASFL
ncbi:MAG: hypothetical protein GTO41_11010, partial [Burkholderiales bacterium]|nr:hypothetical protein [Burkholderiales bacterium]